MGKADITFLRVPTFDLSWLVFPSAGESFVLLAGGGGSAKSGVRNQIQIAGKGGKGALHFDVVDHVETDTAEKSSLCSALVTGDLHDSVVVAAALGGLCRIYTVTSGNEIVTEEQTEKDKKKGPPKGLSGLKFEQAVEFEADFSTGEDGPSINCIAIISSGLVVTGGDDGVCRIWSVDFSGNGTESSDAGGASSSSSSSSSSSWTATLEVELKKHTGPIMALSLHPSEPLLCSASKDGSCIMWNLKLGTVLVEIPRIDGISGVGSVASPIKDSKGNPISANIECRGCCFSQDGTFLYSLQCGRRGSVSNLIKWDFKEGRSSPTKDEKSHMVVEAVPSKVVVVAKVPSTKLRLSEDGLYIAVGTSNGEVVVFSTETMAKVKSLQCHDLPVTGLGFAPFPVVHSSGYAANLTSCSADNKMVTIPIGGFSVWFILLYVLLSLLFLFGLVYFSYTLFLLYVK